MSFWATFISVVLVVALADFCWSMYITATTELKPIKSGLWAVAIIFTGAYATISFMNDNRIVFASALGAFIGTTSTVYWNKRRKQNDK